MSDHHSATDPDPGDDPTGERFMRFLALYREVLKSDLDALEFAEDDLYAFQVLDRAFRSDNQDLRNLAAHLQTRREAALETITMRATEINESTRRLKTLEPRNPEPQSRFVGPVGEGAGASGAGGTDAGGTDTGGVNAGGVDVAGAAGDGDGTASGSAAPRPGEAAASAGEGTSTRRRRGWFG